MLVGKAEISLENAVALAVIEGSKAQPAEIEDHLVLGIGAVQALILQVQFLKFRVSFLGGKGILQSLQLRPGVGIGPVSRHQLIQQEQQECQQDEDDYHIE